MQRSRTLFALVLVASAGLFFAGCSDQPTDDEDAGGGGTDVVEDTGGDDAQDGGDDGGTADAGDTGDIDEEDDGGTEDASDGGGGSCSTPGCVTDRYKVEQSTTCQQDDPPARCSEDPGAFSDWGKSSILTNLELTSDEASSCCFDLDGDEQNENALAGLLGLINSQSSGPGIDKQVKASIANGELMLLQEHQGLDDLSNTDEFTMNFFLGESGSETSGDFANAPCDLLQGESCQLETSVDESFWVNPDSFDEGTFPEARVPDGSVESGNVSAGPGKVILNLDVEALGNISLTINGATIEGTIDSENSGSGVTITEGKLGGYVLVRDVIGLINDLMSTCSCLNNPQEALEITAPNHEEGDPDLCAPETPEDDCSVACTEEVANNTDSCGDNSPSICRVSGVICDGTSVITGAPDLDVDGDHAEYEGSPHKPKDAISIGAVFETIGADITGVEAYVGVEDQAISSDSTSEITVPEAFMATEGSGSSGWLVIHADDNGSPGAVLGTAQLDAGWNRDVTVSLNEGESVSTGTTVHAMLHEDTGEQGTYEFDGSSGSADPPLSDYNGEVYVKSFQVVAAE